MTIAQLAPSSISRGSTRWLLLGSLALNLFFVGVALAMAIRGPEPSAWDRDVFVRVERLAATLPPADAALLRGGVNADRSAIEETQRQYRAAQSAIRAVLRQETFDVTAMRAAMVKARAARLNFDQNLQGVFADAAAKMSPAGRHALADWPPNRKSASK